MTTISTNKGPILGKLNNGVHTFLGIPFAQPVSGENRWRLPQEMEPWSSELDCRQHRGTAEHFDAFFSMPSFGKKTRQVLKAAYAPKAHHPVVDDCLNAAVWTTSVDPDSCLPVMVYIHGGAYTTGSTMEEVYEGTRLSRHGVVVVTLQYRLGPPGFAHLGENFDDDLGADNRAFYDLLAGLRWVQENVRQFGGDPNCVTIFGESAGGGAVLSLAGSPLGRGLFHRAISMSGVDWGAPVEEMNSYYSELFSQAGIDPKDRQALVDMNAAQRFKLFKKIMPVSAKQKDKFPLMYSNPMGNAGFASGTEFMPSHPATAMAENSGADVDLMIGSMRDDGHLLSIILPGPRRFAGKLGGMMLAPNLYNQNHKEAIKDYQALMPGIGKRKVRDRLINDAMFKASVWKHAEQHAKGRPGTTWVYQINHESDVANIGSIHALDVPFVFDNVENSMGLLEVNQANQTKADQLAATWVAFAKTGNPNNSSIPEWKPYDNNDRPGMIFDSENTCVDDHDKAFRELWSVR